MGEHGCLDPEARRHAIGRCHVALHGRKLRISAAGKILYFMTRVQVAPPTFRSRFCRKFCDLYASIYGNSVLFNTVRATIIGLSAQCTCNCSMRQQQLVGSSSLHLFQNTAISNVHSKLDYCNSLYYNLLKCLQEFHTVLTTSLLCSSLFTITQQVNLTACKQPNPSPHTSSLLITYHSSHQCT